MADQSGSARFQTPSFESALQAYEEKTGITLAQHPLALELHNYQSIHDISILLQGRTQAFGNSRAKDRMMKAIKTIVSLLTRLGHAATPAESVRQKVLMACSTSLTRFSDIISTYEGNICWPWHITGCMYHSLIHV
jgi:hypothetical protein